MHLFDMKRFYCLLFALLATVLLTGCEGMVDPSRKTNDGINTLYFQLDGEAISAGGLAPDWVRGLFGIFAGAGARDGDGRLKEPGKSVHSGIVDSLGIFWIEAFLTVNSWEADRFVINIPLNLLREKATIEYPHFSVALPYVSGYYRDEAFTQGYAYTPTNREAEFLSGALHIRKWDQDEGILSGEFKFKVRMVSEGISPETFRGHSTLSPQEYVVRPKETHELSISRGQFDVNYLE